MQINFILTELDPSDPDSYATMDDGRKVRLGYPLRDYLARMDKDGYIAVSTSPMARNAGLTAPLTAEHPAMSAALSHATGQGIDILPTGPETYKVSIAQWRKRDPDKTFLRVAWTVKFSPEEQARMAGSK